LSEILRDRRWRLQPLRDKLASLCDAFRSHEGIVVPKDKLLRAFVEACWCYLALQPRDDSPYSFVIHELEGMTSIRGACDLLTTVALTIDANWADVTQAYARLRVREMHR
jgi:hypothetical protein